MFSAINTSNLDKFLQSIGRDPSYVDLEVNTCLLIINFI